MTSVAFEAFDVPPDADPAFLADWTEARPAGGALLCRALRLDVRPRYVAIGRAAGAGPGDPHRLVWEDGAPEGAGGVLLIEPFAVPAGADERFLAGWTAVRERFAAQRGYLGARLYRGADRFVAVVRWSSPLMYARTLRQPEVSEAIAALPFPGRPALYLPVDA